MTKKTFEVLSRYLYGNDWEQCQVVNAYDHGEAAELWAEREDERGDYNIIGEGEHGPVLVREVGSINHKTYNIIASSVPRYNAQES